MSYWSLIFKGFLWMIEPNLTFSVVVGFQFVTCYFSLINTQWWPCPCVGTSGCEREIRPLVKKLWWAERSINPCVMAIPTIKTRLWISFRDWIHSEHLIFFFHPFTLSHPLFSYLLNWFEFCHFGNMEKMKYRFWGFLPILSLREHLLCQAPDTFLNLYDSNITLSLIFFPPSVLASKWEPTLSIIINMRNLIYLTQLCM